MNARSLPHLHGEFQVMLREPCQHERQFITVMRSVNGPGTRWPRMASGSLPNIASLTNMKGNSEGKGGAGGVELDKGGAERGRGKGRGWGMTVVEAVCYWIMIRNSKERVNRASGSRWVTRASVDSRLAHHLPSWPWRAIPLPSGRRHNSYCHSCSSCYCPYIYIIININCSQLAIALQTFTIKMMTVIIMMIIIVIFVTVIITFMVITTMILTIVETTARTTTAATIISLKLTIK